MPAIAIHKTSTDDGKWDGPANEKNLRSGEDAAYYKKMYAWQDPEGDLTTKAAYKFPHHLVDSDGNPGDASVRGCQSGISVLNGAMGGADIPDDDRQGVYDHLAAHLKDADVEPADLRSNIHDTVEQRSFTTRELRVVIDGPTRHIEGYSAVFDVFSEPMWGFREKIRKGAFSKTIQESDIRALWNHDSNYVLGRLKAGTLELSEDDVGLRIRITPPDTQWARDLMTTIDRGDVDQMSFGFQTIRDEWFANDDIGTIRTLIEVKLFDVSPVTFPAYPQTSVQVRSVLGGLGIDAEALASAINRSRSGSISPADREIVTRAATILNSIATAAPGQESHPTEPDEARLQEQLSKLRRQLQRLETF